MIMTLAELSDATGFTVETIIRYEAMGLVRPILIGEFKRYSANAKIRLELIRKGKRLGFTLHEIMSIVEHYEMPSEGDLASDSSGNSDGDAPSRDR